MECTFFAALFMLTENWKKWFLKLLNETFIFALEKKHGKLPIQGQTMKALIPKGQKSTRVIRPTTKLPIW